MGRGEGRSQLQKAWSSFRLSHSHARRRLRDYVTDDESDPHEQRFISLGPGAKGRVLVVVYSHRHQDIRIISARPAEPHERQQYEENR
jgi:uncharacterized DUF497 family protein